MFGKNFVWGAATSAYQIEGAAYEDGKGLNIWDVFCKQDWRIFENNSGDTACDHYHRMEEDVALMAELGIKAYRFSINWARLLPNGVGKINQSGIDFYNRLIDLLIENGIEPYITLYHWDLPYELYLRGGFLNREIADWFAEYAALVGKSFGDRVTHFMTINEPQVVVGLGYQDGAFAPGLRLHRDEVLRAGHNLLRAHGAAVKALRKSCAKAPQIGIVMATTPHLPIKEELAQSAINAYGKTDINSFVYADCYWLDPIVFGKYPEPVEHYIKQRGLPLLDDMELISQPVDFIGSNIYQGNYYNEDDNGNPLPVPNADGYPRTPNGWKITPDALYWGAAENCTRYKLPYYICENGTALNDYPLSDGKIHDDNRIEYLKNYLAGLEKAKDEGYDVRGYFAWSLLDNFEWASGYRDRFGLIYVDFETKDRIIKNSGYWYRDFIAQQSKE